MVVEERARTTPACPACDAHESTVDLSGHDRMIGDRALFLVRTCARCGLAFTSPRQIDFEQRYPSSDYHAYRPGRDSKLNRLRMWLIARVAYDPIARGEPGQLLDVGCGAGELALAFRRLGWNVSGVEPSRQGAEVASGRGVEVHNGTLDDAHWEPGSFDAVVLNHSLEHLPDPVAAIAGVRELLRPGGLVGISVPNFGSWQRRLFAAHWFQLDLPRHLQHFDAVALRRLVESQGFRVIRVRSTSMMAGVPGSLQYAAFGRQVLHGRLNRALAMLLYPLVAALTVVTSGDCLNLVAVRKP